MLAAGHSFGNIESQSGAWVFTGSLQDLWNFDELLVSLCGFFHVSSTSAFPDLNSMAQLISFWTLLFWLFFLGGASCCPQQHFGDNNGLLLVFKGAVGHHWLFKCFQFKLFVGASFTPPYTHASSTPTCHTAQFDTGFVMSFFWMEDSRQNIELS